MARFPTSRPRRMRATPQLRSLVRETRLDASQLLLPIFVTAAGEGSPIDGLPGHDRVTVEGAARRAEEVAAAGVAGVVLFGIPAGKDARGSEAWAADGVVQRAVAAVRDAAPNLLVVTDVCLCQYTDHGHCGALRRDGSVDNDETLELLGRVATSHAAAGAHIVAPSDMMDGRVGTIRSDLDAAGHVDVALMAYSTKFASAFYGPFRAAAGSAPLHGDRRSYQLDPANRREAVRESVIDEDEGADVLMVKPALAYLDIVRDVREATTLPLACYHVSGEYAMVRAAAERGWLDERAAMLESLVAMRRAGADIIITYAALDAARWLADA